jgi:hypothetical protein
MAQGDAQVDVSAELKSTIRRGRSIPSTLELYRPFVTLELDDSYVLRFAAANAQAFSGAWWIPPLVYCLDNHTSLRPPFVWLLANASLWEPRPTRTTQVAAG